MNNLSDMIWIEMRKALRSRIPLFTILGSLFPPLGVAFLVFVSRNPDISRKLGLISAKASLMSLTATNWPAYLVLSAQIIAAGDFFFFCMIASWIFGREFTDGTLKDMLAVPVSRASILIAKFTAAGIWCAVLTLVTIIFSLVVGTILQLPQASTSILLQGTVVMAVTACLTFVTITPFAFLASVGRGYLLPIGVAILALMMANVFQVAGWGEYYPWAVAGLYTQAKSSLSAVSYGIVVLTGLAGMIATYLWWKYADQSR